MDSSRRLHPPRSGTAISTTLSDLPLHGDSEPNAELGTCPAPLSTHSDTAYLAERYGRRRTPRQNRRSLTIVLAALTLIASVGVAVWLFRTHGEDGIQQQVVAYRVISTTEIEVSVRVTKPTDEAVRCRVRARSRDGGEVGSIWVTAPAGSSTLDETYLIPTAARAITGEIGSCTPTPTDS